MPKKGIFGGRERLTVEETKGEVLRSLIIKSPQYTGELFRGLTNAHGDKLLPNRLTHSVRELRNDGLVTVEEDPAPAEDDRYQYSINEAGRRYREEQVAAEAGNTAFGGLRPELS